MRVDDRRHEIIKLYITVNMAKIIVIFGIQIFLYIGLQSADLGFQLMVYLTYVSST